MYRISTVFVIFHIFLRYRAFSLPGQFAPRSESANRTATSQLPVTVISSHGHVVTRSTRHRSTRHTHVSSHSQLVTRQHITKPAVRVIIILSARCQETSRNSAQHGRRKHRYLCYFNVYCRLQITATDYTST